MNEVIDIFTLHGIVNRSQSRSSGRPTGVSSAISGLAGVFLALSQQLYE
jgi:hypothetical protein